MSTRAEITSSSLPIPTFNRRSERSDQLRRGIDHFREQPSLRSRFRREEPGLRDQRRERLAGEHEVRLRGRVLLFRAALAVANPSPEVEFPGRADQPALYPGARRRTISPPPRPSAVTAGQSSPPAARTYAAACSARAAETRRSLLYCIASATSASSRVSAKVASQSSSTLPLTAPAAFHSAGAGAWVNSCSFRSSEEGDGTRTQPEMPPNTSGTTTDSRMALEAPKYRCRFDMSVQLEDEPVRDTNRRA